MMTGWTDLHAVSLTFNAKSQAIAFLNAHSESLLIILKDSPNYVTATSLEEMRLLVAFLGMVAHRIPSDEMVSAPTTVLTTGNSIRHGRLPPCYPRDRCSVLFFRVARPCRASGRWYVDV